MCPLPCRLRSSRCPGRSAEPDRDHAKEPEADQERNAEEERKHRGNVARPDLDDPVDVQACSLESMPFRIRAGRRRKGGVRDQPPRNPGRDGHTEGRYPRTRYGRTCLIGTTSRNHSRSQGGARKRPLRRRRVRVRRGEGDLSSCPQLSGASNRNAKKGAGGRRPGSGKAEGQGDKPKQRGREGRRPGTGGRRPNNP